MLNLTDEYHRLCREPSDIYLHLPRLHALVEQTNAQHVIELGTRSGVSTIAFLHALESTGGRLTSIDIDAAPPLQSDRWTFVQGDDLDPRIVADLEPADIVFIDTSHFYEHTLAELHVYRWLASRFIVCHDTELRQPIGAPPHPAFPVKQAIDEFTLNEGLRWTNHPECWGLGVVEIA